MPVKILLDQVDFQTVLDALNHFRNDLRLDPRPRTRCGIIYYHLSRGTTGWLHQTEEDIDNEHGSDLAQRELAKDDMSRQAEEEFRKIARSLLDGCTETLTEVLGELENLTKVGQAHQKALEELIGNSEAQATNVRLLRKNRERLKGAKS